MALIRKTISVAVAVSLLGGSLPGMADVQALLEIERRATTESYALQAAYILSADSSDLDGDGFHESPAMLTGAGGPGGGGLIPLSSSAPKSDGYGFSLGYCAWDNGATNSSTGRISGALPATNGQKLIAVVAPGADGVFDTSCSSIYSGGAAGNDDYVAAFSVLQVQQGGSPTLYYGSPVANAAALAALDSAALMDGQLRITLDNNSLHRWNSTLSTWSTVGGGGSSQWTSSGDDVYFGGAVTGNVGVGGAPLAKLHVQNGVARFDGGISVGASELSDANRNVTANSLTFVDGDGNRVVVNSGGYGLGFNTNDFSAYIPAAGSFSVRSGGYAGSQLLTVNGTSGMVSALGGYAVGGTTVIDSTRNANVATLSVDGTPVIDSGRNLINVASLTAAGQVDAGSLAIGGTSVVDASRNLVNIGAITASGLITTSSGYKVGATSVIDSARNASFAGLTTSVDASINGVTVGHGGGGVVSNVAVGASALISSSGGGFNTAVGRYALTTNATGNYNSALGESALRSNSSGSYNSAIGVSALRATTTGLSNSAMGFGAMFFNTTGNSNAAYGSSALYYNTVGNNSTAIGTNSLFNSTGSGNIGLGYNAGMDITTGSYNVVIGGNAGTAIATSNNVVLLADGQGNERWRIPSTGNMLLGGTTDDGVNRLQVSGSASVAGGAVTTAVSPLTIAQTWNSAGTSFPGVVFNVTDTASAAGAKLFDLQTGGVSKFSVRKDGTITNGIWGGTAIGVAAGGLGLTAAPTNGQIPIGNGTGYSLATLTGTANQVTVTNGAGTVTLSLPQSINVGASPTFAGLGVNADNITVGGITVGKGGGGSSTSSAFGINSLSANTTGIRNTGFGHRTLYSSTTGSGNTALGYNALYTVNGEQNIGIGHSAGSGLTTGSYNVIIGGNTGAAIATSSNVVLLADGQGNERWRIPSTGNMLLGGTADDGVNRLQVSGSASVAGGAVTTAVSPLSVAQTWNNVATTFPGVLFNATDTASAAASSLIDLQLGGVSKFAVRKDGTILNATWGGAPMGVAAGGLGLTAAPTNGQIPIGNGTGYSLATLTGTANQVTVTNGAGTVTLSLPQSINVGASPTFAGLTANGLVNTTTGYQVGGTTVVDASRNASVVGLTATGQVTGSAGSAAAPSYTFAGSTSTGLYLPAANQIGFSVSGVSKGLFNANGLTVSPGAATTAVSPLSVAQTWNNVATTFPGIVYNVTDTASAAASKLLDLQTGGVSKFSVRKDGTITNGIWGGTAIGVAAGGLGLTAAPTNGQIPIGNGTGYSLATLSGTVNQVTVTNGAGTVTLSLPQNIHTGATPTFAGLTANGLVNTTTGYQVGGTTVVDASRNASVVGLTASSNASVGGTLATTGAATFSSTVTVTGALTANNGITVPNGKTIKAGDGTATSTGIVQAGLLQVDATVASGGACTQLGQIGRDASGVMYSCQN